MKNLSQFWALLLFVFAVILISCNNEKPCSESQHAENVTDSAELIEDPWLTAIENAHEKERFVAEDAIEFDLVLSFGGKERFNGTMLLSTDSRFARITSNSGDSIYVHDDKVFHDKDLSNPESVRFTAYTWSYFFLFPYKLSDPGTNWVEPQQYEIGDINYSTKKLTFGEHVGDAPDDWYILFPNPETNLTDYSAYIVTAGQSQEEAEKDPHAIQYRNYRAVNGVPIAHDWTFWGWRSTEGLTDTLGSARLSNVRFVNTTENTFRSPKGFLTK